MNQPIGRRTTRAGQPVRAVRCGASTRGRRPKPDRAGRTPADRARPGAVRPRAGRVRAEPPMRRCIPGGSCDHVGGRRGTTGPPAWSGTEAKDLAGPIHRLQSPPVENVSRDWTSGRSTQGGGYDESMRAAEGFGAAGHRRVGRPGPSSTSGATPAGRSARSPAPTSSTSSGSIARRSVATTGRRSTRSCARVAGANRPDAEGSDRRGLYRRR